MSNRIFVCITVAGYIVFLLCVLAIIANAVACASGPAYVSGSLYDAEFYYLKADGKVHTILITRDGAHHVVHARKDL